MCEPNDFYLRVFTFGFDRESIIPGNFGFAIGVWRLRERGNMSKSKSVYVCVFHDLKLLSYFLHCVIKWQLWFPAGMNKVYCCCYCCYWHLAKFEWPGLYCVHANVYFHGHSILLNCDHSDFAWCQLSHDENKQTPSPPSTEINSSVSYFLIGF